jgi:polysaccharide biosynthesis transport protein
LKLISLQSVMHDKHPDIVKARREIIELENQVGVTVDPGKEIKRLNSLKEELAAMEGRHEPKHPDMVKINKEIIILEQSVANKEGSNRIQKISENNPDNPVYINLMTQISSVNAAIANLINDRQGIEQELSKYRKRIENAPFVEKEYNELTRDYYTKKQKYDDLMNKLLDANVAKGIEKREHGQRFEIKDYAYLPKKPHKPNRMAIITLGFFLASVLGLGIVSVQEFFDHSIKNEKELNRLFDVPVLAVISKVETKN